MAGKRSDSAGPGRPEGVDDAVLVLAQLLGRDEVGGRGEEEAVGPLGRLLDPGAYLVERPGGAVGVDHLVADRGRDGGEVAAAEGRAGGDRVIGEAVKLPERHVGLDGRVE